MQSQEEITKLIDFSMRGKEEISMVEFKGLTEKVCSTIYLCVSHKRYPRIVVPPAAPTLPDLLELLHILQQETARAQPTLVQLSRLA